MCIKNKDPYCRLFHVNRVTTGTFGTKFHQLEQHGTSGTPAIVKGIYLNENMG
jgi:hypothetical protein